MSDRSNVAVALLYQSESASQHVRETLAAIGTPITYEAAAGALDRDALSRSQATVVVVNLEDEDDPALDEVYSLLDDARYRVIFNDSGVSSGLEGWDQARWVRHLSAKVLGDAQNIDPPRPLDAEPVPVRARAVAPVVPPTEQPAAPVAAPVTVSGLELAEPAPADTGEASKGPVADIAPAAPAFDPTEFLDLLEDAPSADSYGGAAAARDLPSVDIEAAGESIELGGIDELLADFDVHSPEPIEESGAVEEFVLEIAPEDVPVAAGIRPADELEIVPAADVPDAFDVDFDFDLDQALSVPPEATATSAPAPEERKLGALADTWSLESDAPPAPTGPANFGIEKVTASEYLAPEGGDAEQQPPMPSLSELSLELIPMEEAVSPTRAPSPDHENWFDPDSVKAKIQHVWVLGASVGGPESVREFLGEFPREFPALFLLAQHLGDEFVDMMTKQLAKATQLTVRTPSHGERVAHGDIVVVPNSHRLQVDPMGVVVLERNTTESAYQPSIDRVIEDVASRYGASAGAIIFSGMSDDAVAGARALAEKGGTIYVQSPESCVVGTMVEGVIESGVASFVGTPKELAAKLIAGRDSN